jgi:hypothetical protein
VAGGAPFEVGVFRPGHGFEGVGAELRDFVLQDEATMLAPLLEAFTTLAANLPNALKAGILERIGNIILEDDETRLEELRTELDQGVVDTQTESVVDPQTPVDGGVA